MDAVVGYSLRVTLQCTEQAAQQLNDLAKAIGPAKAKSIAEKFRKDKPHSRTLISELRTAGLL